MLLWVLAANPACRFYESLGGVRLDSKWEVFGSTRLEEVAYSWPDLTAALATLEQGQEQ
jgi:hypothetical protein